MPELSLSYPHAAVLTTGSLLRPENDAPARQVVGRQLHRHLVAGQDADVMHPHLARDVSQYHVSVFQLHSEGRIRQGLENLALHLYRVFLRHALPVYLVGNTPPLKFAFLSRLSYWWDMM